MNELKQFRFWCQSVLPIVYDGSLSYYEVLCKCADYINKLIETDNGIIKDIDELKTELEQVQYMIEHFDTSVIKEMVDKYVATMIFVEISNAGYIVYHIPSSWKDITFNTTGIDIEIPNFPDFGHLVLSY